MFTIKKLFINKRTIIVMIILMGLVVYSISANITSKALAYLIASNSPFLIYFNAYIILFYLRIKTYENVHTFSAVRISNDILVKKVMKLELSIFMIYIIVIYFILAGILGFEHVFVPYIIMLAVQSLIYIFIIFSFLYDFLRFKDPKIKLATGYLLFILYNYMIKDYLLNLLNGGLL